MTVLDTTCIKSTENSLCPLLAALRLVRGLCNILYLTILNINMSLRKDVHIIYC